MAEQSIRAIHRVWAFAGLLVLATLSLILGVSLHFYWGDVAVSLGIAGVKTILVLWFFMDLAEQPFRSRLAIGVAVLLLLLLVGLAVTDVATRTVMPHAPAPQAREGFFQR